MEKPTDNFKKINSIVQSYEHLGILPVTKPSIIEYVTIVTRALNNDWHASDKLEPHFYLWFYFNEYGFFGRISIIRPAEVGASTYARVCFKSHDIAVHALKQFRDLYLSFVIATIS